MAFSIGYRLDAMRYVLSDSHGEYELFEQLLLKLNFSLEDEMYICGDIIDKGDSSIRLAKYISSFPNMYCVIGNHELSFLKFYHSLLQESPDDFDAVLRRLQAYFPEDGELLDWELVDWFDSLSSYIEKADYICVHAGIPLDDFQRLEPLSEVGVEQLVYNRKFKDPNVIHNSPKCVFFGHTQTDCICGENIVLKYCRNSNISSTSVRDYYKIQLDTGSWSNGVLECFCIDTLETFYIKKEQKL